MAETELITKIIIILIVINLSAILISYFLTQGVSIPSLNGLRSIEHSLNTTESNLANATNTSKLTFQYIPASSGGGVFSLLGNITIIVQNAFLGLINYVILLADVVFQLISLCLIGFGIIIYIVLVVIPSIFNLGFGVFAPIFDIIDGLMILGIGIYAFELISGIIGRFAGFVGMVK